MQQDATISTTCWILDPMIDRIIDVIIDIDPNVQTVLQVRHALNLGNTPGPVKERYCRSVQRWLQSIATCNSAIYHAVPLPNARNNVGDVGAMHALGTRVQNGGLSTVPYATNDCVHCRTLRDMVIALHKIGNQCFPDILSVILSTEADSGLRPIVPMDGTIGNHVGHTIDMSVNLGNSSHYDINDALQSFAVWTEENPSMGSNWYVVLPNVHGARPDGVPLSGLAVCLSYGVAISWDGRALRHCTSISMPDGPDGERAGRNRRTFQNNLFGTFTSAKERVLAAGRALHKNPGAAEM